MTETRELANAIFEYLEIFHNCRHFALGGLAPLEFESRQPITVPRFQYHGSTEPGTHQSLH
ncbi:IS3 family transposase [Cellulomonas sp. APG4]|uniref:IS3 family transposase n=1 Tax=Cellulomonas sp. APG4 TaxID=1538656 RepID=UPI00351B7D5F